MAKTVEKKERESKTDIAYRIMSTYLVKKKKMLPVNFYDLWETVKEELAKELEPSELENIEDDISFFYTNLTLDGRFVNVGENKWDLRENVKFEKVHLDPNEIYGNEDENMVIEDDEENYVQNSDDVNESYDESAESDSDFDSFREQSSEDEENY